jgi:hypothetical protein
VFTTLQICIISLLVLLLALSNSQYCSVSLAATIDSNKFSEEVRLDNEDCSGFLLRINGRNIVIARGSCLIGGKKISVTEPTELTIVPCASLEIKAEEFSLVTKSEDHPIYTRMPLACLAGKGTGPLPQRVVPGTLKMFRVKDGQPGEQYTEGVDYSVDPRWSSIERKESGSAAENEKVLLQYSVYRRRVDAIVLTGKGSIELIAGALTQFGPSPPKVPGQSVLLANVLAESLDQKLSASSIMAVYRVQKYPNPEFAELNTEALARTKKKLEVGSSVKIAFCGDSVTHGSYSSCGQASFPSVFLDKLTKKFPRSTVQYLNFSQGGASSTTMFPIFYDKILPQHPDLIIVEFVNDIALDRQTVLNSYTTFFEGARAAGAEVIVCLPHLPAPSYYGVKGWSAVAGKPYFSIIKKLAAEHKVGLADIAARWETAAREGIDPMLLLADELNHPNDRGHEIYAEELIRCFD